MCSSLGAIVLLSSPSTRTIAKPIVVTRGPNGAAHVVKSDKIPLDAKVPPMSQSRQFPKVQQKGPGGATHLVTPKKYRKTK